MGKAGAFAFSLRFDRLPTSALRESFAKFHRASVFAGTWTSQGEANKARTLACCGGRLRHERPARPSKDFCEVC